MVGKGKAFSPYSTFFFQRELIQNTGVISSFLLLIISCIIFSAWVEPAEDLNNSAAVSDYDVEGEIQRFQTLLSVQSKQIVLNVYSGLMERIQQKEAALEKNGLSLGQQ